MTGLKSGSGDDLWGDDGDDETDTTDETTGARAKEDEASDGRGTDSVTESEPSTQDLDDRAGPAAGSESASGESADETRSPDATETTKTADAPATGGTEASETANTAEETASTEGGEGSSTLGVDLSSVESESTGGSQSYIVRRAVQDKSVQFERDERLTFFVHDDVADGERDLITGLQSALGRDVPKFDVREAVYRAALQNPDDVLAELLEMGYSIDEE